MSVLITLLSGELGRVVVDRTQFSEEFSFELDYAPLELAAINLDTPRGADVIGTTDALPLAPSLSDALYRRGNWAWS